MIAHCNYANVCESFCGCRGVTISIHNKHLILDLRFTHISELKRGANVIKKERKQGKENANKEKNECQKQCDVSVAKARLTRAINNWNNLSFVCVVLFCQLILFISTYRVPFSFFLHSLPFPFSFELNLHCLWGQWRYVIDFSFL